GEMVRAVDFQYESQFHAAEVGRVGRHGTFVAKLLAADLPVANPLPDGLREFICRGALVARESNGFRGSGAAAFHETPSPPAPLPAAGRGEPGSWGDREAARARATRVTLARNS